MSRERWFRGDHEGQEPPFDWYGLARAHEVPVEQAQMLYEQARRQARESRRPAREIYLALIEEARPPWGRPAPGKVTRTMRLAAERAGKRRRKTPGAPGKRTLTSYLEPPTRERRPASQERERLEAIAESFRTLGVTVPADLQGALARAGRPADQADQDEASRANPFSTGAGAGRNTWAGRMSVHPAPAATVFRKQADPHGSTQMIEPDGIEETLRSVIGQPLPERLRREMEHLLGAELTSVRVQTGDRAATAAAAAGANAFTIGPNIFFARGQYQPDSVAGRELLLHELVHVVQWLRGQVPAARDLRIAERSDPLEREAEATVQRLAGRLGPAVAAAGDAATTRADAAQGAPGPAPGIASTRPAAAPGVTRGLLLRQASDAGPSSVQLPDGGEPVGQVGIVNWDGSPQVRLRAVPDTRDDNIVAHLPFNTQVQVIRRFPGGWYFVSTPSGQMGYVAATYVWTHLPEPNARLHRVASGRSGFAISIAERYYGVHADDWGQDLRFYVNVLAWVNDIPVPSTTSGWREVHFAAGHLIWIPSLELARSLQGVVDSGSLSYNVADSLGIADFAERAGELWDDIRRAVDLSGQYMGEAIRRHTEQALWNALEALAILLVAAVAILAVSTAIGAGIGALAGGVGAAPGAAVGFEVGMALLEWLGLALLVVWIGDALLRVGSAFGRFLGTVWGARGDQSTIDRAAREFAEAIGTLLGVLLEGVVLLGTMHGLGKALGMLRGTRFGQVIGESLLGRWLSQRVQNAGEGRGPIPGPRSVLRGRRGRGQQEGESGQAGEHGTGEGRSGEGRSGEGRGGEGNASEGAPGYRGSGERSAGEATAGERGGTGERGGEGGRTGEPHEASPGERAAEPSRSHDPAARTEAELRADLDPNPRPGETPAGATERVRLAQEEILKRQVSIYEALGHEPRRVNLRVEEPTYPDAHTIERHGSDISLYRSENPGGRTIEGRIHGDPPWARPENGSARWLSDSIMHRIVNDYIRSNWEAVRSDLAMDRRHVAAFDAGRLVGEGFYNGGAHGMGPRSAVPTRTSLVRIIIVLDPGTPPSFHVVTAFPNILGTPAN